LRTRNSCVHDPADSSDEATVPTRVAVALAGEHERWKPREAVEATTRLELSSDLRGDGR
jgi:hypothetical protein